MSDAAATAGLLRTGIVGNADAAVNFRTFLDLDLTESVAAVTALTDQVKANNLGDLEAMLAAQAVSLNAVYLKLLERARANMGEYPEATERYLRLGFRAQAQCSATIERLFLMKNPTGAVFAKQANIAHGPQQVNNTVHAAPSPLADPRAQEAAIAPSKLLSPHGE